MGLIQQTWTLTLKNLLIVFVRHWFSTTIRAFVLPIIFMFFISYAKNFFVPPSEFGIGSPSPIRSLPDALHASIPSRDTVAFVHNGHSQGDIGDVINQLSTTIRAAGKKVQVLEDESSLATVCRSSLRGVSPCFGAADFISSPTQGSGGRWNYTLRADGALGARIFVNRDSNDAQVYVLPFQHAIDQAIASMYGRNPLPDTVEEYPFTSQTPEERDRTITRLYQGTLMTIISVAFFVGMVGVTYQLVGHMALERENGMSQLIEAMMPNKRRWEPQAARLLANHLAFDIIYLPAWIIMGLIVAYLVFPQSDAGILVGLHLLVGFSLSSFSLFCGSFFKKAQLSGITTTIISLVLGIIAQIPLGSHGSTGAIVVLGLLFPPMNYVFFLIYLAGFQQKTLPGNLTEYSPASDWQVRGTTLIGLLIVQIFVFPFLGAAVERSLYGTASKTRRMHYGNEESSISVKLASFSKLYGPGFWARHFLPRTKRHDEVVAVNDLSLDILHGQIMVLLGANGSGKSTTLDAIAGLNSVSKGSIDIDAKGGLGLCPQKNVLWDELTVAEHVRIFDRLKSTSSKASKTDISDLVEACDLGIKLKARSKTLSGGQKRKLQLAMMFTGGSRVCCVDEVSSGIDPLARRKIWDILLAERGRRTILLTTHFLDEADVLSDHIAVLSKGNLKAEGTAVQLKHEYGSGYRVFVHNDAQTDKDPEFARIPRVVDYDRTVYQLADSQEVANFTASLEKIHVTDYRVQGPTVEDVFLKLADEIKMDLGMPGEADTESDDSENAANSDKDATSTVKAPAGGLDLLPGHGTGPWQQSRILFRKRFDVFLHNSLPYAAAVLIPIIAGGLVTLFLKGFEPLGCNPGDQSQTGKSFQLSGKINADVPFGPPSAVPTGAIERVYPSLNSTSLHPVTSEAGLNNFINMNFHNVTPGGFWLGQNGGTPIFAWLGEYTVGFSAQVQNAVDSLLGGTLISTAFTPLAIPFSPNAGDTLQLILYFGLAMSAYPGFLALYPTAERLRKVRALHYSNGIRSGPLWTAYTAFDFIFVLLVSAITVIIFAAQWSGWYYPGYLFVVFFLYGLTSTVYCYVISLFTTSQLATFAFASGSQCILFLLYFIAYLAILTYGPVNQIDHYVSVAHFTISIITPAGNMARSLLLTLNEFSLLCRGTHRASYPGDISVYGGPILYLIVQFFVLLAFLIWWDSGGRFSFGLFKRSSKHAAEQDMEDRKTAPDQDPEVREELFRVQSSQNNGLRVLNVTKAFGTNVAVEDVTFGVRKSEVFALLGPNGAGKSTTISLVRGDIRPSTTGGDIFVEEASLSRHRAAARNHLGVCPQFDAMDQMTTVQHLRFYARVRGVADVDHNVAQVMRAVGLTPYRTRMALKLSGGNKRKLSLAIALMGNPSVLLLDEPSSGMDAAAKRVMWRVLSAVTTGRALCITTHSMEEADALADRAGIMARRMLALGTTEHLRRRHGDAYHVHLVLRGAPHVSSEEMARVKGWVREHVPGADVEERTWGGQVRFGVPNRDHDAAPVHAETSDRKAGDIGLAIDGSDQTQQPRPDRGAGTGTGIRALFELLEANKNELGFSYYSVAPTTLDQVFLNVVQKHNVQEENYAREGGTPGAVRWDRRVAMGLKTLFGMPT